MRLSAIIAAVALLALAPRSQGQPKAPTPAQSQTQTRKLLAGKKGTVIVLGASHNSIVVAADSRATALGDGSVSDSNCKISNYGGRLIFASSGLSELDPQKRAKIAWDSHEFARRAWQSVEASRGAEKSASAVAEKWGADAASYFRKAMGHNGETFSRDMGMHSSVIVAGMFAGSNGRGGIVATTQLVMFAISPKNDKQMTVVSEARPLAPGPENESVTWRAIGDIAVPYEFLQHRSHRAQPLFARWLDSVSDRSDAERMNLEAAQLVQWTIDYARAHDVGGAVDSIAIDAGGMHWLQRKDACPETE